MKHLIRILSIVIVVLIGYSASGQNVGSPLPDFTLNSYEGIQYKLSDQKGKVVLIFMFGYACPYCLSVGPDIQSEFVNAYASDINYTSFGIDTWNGSNSGVSNFQKTTGLTMPLLVQGSSVASSWQTSYDRLLVVDAEGILVYKGISGASGTIDQAKLAVDAALGELTTGIDKEVNKLSTELLQNYPNPFSEQTTVTFSLAKASVVQLDIYDVTGRNVRQLVENYYAEGKHKLVVQRGDLRSGIYYYRLSAGPFSQTRKMIIR